MLAQNSKKELLISIIHALDEDGLDVVLKAVLPVLTFGVTGAEQEQPRKYKVKNPLGSGSGAPMLDAIKTFRKITGAGLADSARFVRGEVGMYLSGPEVKALETAGIELTAG